MTVILLRSLIDVHAHLITRVHSVSLDMTLNESADVTDTRTHRRARARAPRLRGTPDWPQSSAGAWPCPRPCGWARSSDYVRGRTNQMQRAGVRLHGAQFACRTVQDASRLGPAHLTQRRARAPKLRTLRERREKEEEKKRGGRREKGEERRRQGWRDVTARGAGEAPAPVRAQTPQCCAHTPKVGNTYTLACARAHTALYFYPLCLLSKCFSLS